ncbi:MAG: hypothetical protein V4671_32675 [Armatimonadota bacterium]
MPSHLAQSARFPHPLPSSFSAARPAIAQAVKTLKPVKGITFRQTENFLLFGVPSLKVRFHDGQVALHDRPPVVWRTTTRTGRQVTVHASSGSQAKPKAPLWKGPVAKAQFIHEVAGGVNTLRDKNATLLWTNAAEAASPDLLMESTEAGEARLMGKKGVLLWSGTLPGKVSGSSINTQDRDTYSIECSGVFIRGVGGKFTVTDNEKQVLWSGTLPKKPLIIVRRGRRFNFSGRNRVVSGTDRVNNIRFAVEQGVVVVTDSQGKVLGNHSVELLQCFDQPFLPQGRSLTPEPVFNKSGLMGKVAFTFKDSQGRIVGRRTLHQVVMTSSSHSRAPHKNTTTKTKTKRVPTQPE